MTATRPRLRRSRRLPALAAVAVLATALDACGPSPKAVRATSPPRTPATIPARTPVIAYLGADYQPPVHAVGWDGTRYRVPAGLPGGGVGRISPDGLSVAAGDGVVTLATGQSAPLGAPAGAELTWADDSRHLCALSGASGSPTPTIEPATLSILTPGSQPRVLARIGVYGGLNSGVHPVVLACSVLENRVLVAQEETDGNATELWAVDPATGAITSHRLLPRLTKSGGDAVTLVASGDGSELAENDVGTATATIRSVPGWAALARLPGQEVHAFSGRGDLVLVTPRPLSLGPGNTTFMHPALLRWRTGQVVWRAPAGLRLFGGLLTEPGGARLAVALNRCPATPGPCVDEIWIVSPGGGRMVVHDVHMLE